MRVAGIAPRPGRLPGSHSSGPEPDRALENRPQGSVPPAFLAACICRPLAESSDPLSGAAVRAESHARLRHVPIALVRGRTRAKEPAHAVRNHFRTRERGGVSKPDTIGQTDVARGRA